MSPREPDPRDQFLAAFPVSRETAARLERYESLLLKANQSLSLISPSTQATIWTRHFLDSAQLARIIPAPEAPVLDIGTGAGFPGLVLAIMGLPHIHVVEHNMRKVAFLRGVIADLGLAVTVHAMKSEAIKPFRAGTVTARALKPLPQLIALGGRFLGPGSVCVFPKGRRAQEELVEAEQGWSMQVERFPSMTDSESTIFRLSEIHAAEPVRAAQTGVWP
jgi:16S rRNA (guanine527-N7)-methyltransferase